MFPRSSRDRRTSPLRPCQRLKHALAFRFYPHPRCRAIHRYIPTENASQQCWEAFFKSYPDLSWFRYIISSPIVNPGQDKSRVSLQRLPSLPHEIRNRCSSVLLRSAGGPFFFAATKNRIGRGRSLSQQTLQAGHFLSRQRRMESDAEDCRRNRRCRRAILLCSNKN